MRGVHLVAKRKVRGHLDERRRTVGDSTAEPGQRIGTRTQQTVWTLVIALIAALVLPAGAAASGTTAPPGNSAVNQYLEVVPTASGGRPDATASPSASTNPSASSHSGPSALSPATQRALAHQGAAGRAVTRLASKAAPASRRTVRRHGAGPSSSGSGPSQPGGGAPLSTLAQSITGGSSAGGSGPWIPVVLVVIAVGGVALAMRRRKGKA